jgi:hypothetical protein
MLDPLARLRDETAREIAEHSDDPPIAPAPEALRRLLTDYFAEREESEIFVIALELLVDQDAGAAATARRSPVPRAPAMLPGNVQQAFGQPGPDVQRGLIRHLGLTEDAAAMLLDRPAAALSRYPARRIAELADSLRASRGRLLRAIAASARDGGEYVFAYRAGAAVDQPAARAEGADDVLAWGRALMEAPNQEA